MKEFIQVTFFSYKQNEDQGQVQPNNQFQGSFADIITLHTTTYAYIPLHFLIW